jgi:hypothetical protein
LRLKDDVAGVSESVSALRKKRGKGDECDVYGETMLHFEPQMLKWLGRCVGKRLWSIQGWDAGAGSILYAYVFAARYVNSFTVRKI